MRTTVLRQLIRETLLLEAHVPEWLQDLLMDTDMHEMTSAVDAKTGKTAFEYFVEDNQKFIDTLVKDHGVGPGSIPNIGQGHHGTVWQLPDGNVLKITSDYGWNELQYKQYLDKMKRQHAGAPESLGDLRILDVFPILWRFPTVDDDKMTLDNPVHAHVAVIMDKIIPTDKNPVVKDLIEEILKVMCFTLSIAAIQFLKPDAQDEAMDLALSAKHPMEFWNLILPWHFKRTSYQNYPIDEKNLDNPDVLRTMSQDFLRMIDVQLKNNPASANAIKALPRAVGEELHIRMHPNWLERLIKAVAQAAREGDSDIKSDNFGIDSKGDIIPFDI